MGKPNPQNLNPPWKKGQSGNPNGRPTWKPIEKAFQDYLANPENYKGKEKQRIEWLIERVFADAMAGKPAAQALVFDRTFGKAKQPVEHSGVIDVPDNRKSVVERLLARNKG